jgi:RelE-like toxin of type II toxin-antitoxin system HigB
LWAPFSFGAASTNELDTTSICTGVSAGIYFPNWAIIRHVADFLESTLGFANGGFPSRGLRLRCSGLRSSGQNVPGCKRHPLKGDEKGHWAVWVSGNWRLTFKFEGEDAILVDYRDYH